MECGQRSEPQIWQRSRSPRSPRGQWKRKRKSKRKSKRRRSSAARLSDMAIGPTWALSLRKLNQARLPLLRRPISELIRNIKEKNPLARTKGGGLRLLDGPEELTAEFEMPNTQDGHDTAELISRGVLRGLSVEMSVPPNGQRWTTLPDGKSLRTITRAKLHGVGIVDSPAYSGSLISQRALEYALGVPEVATEEDSVIWL